MYHDRDSGWGAGCILASDCRNPVLLRRMIGACFGENTLSAIVFSRLVLKAALAFRTSSIIKKLNKEVRYEGSFV